MTSVGIMQGRLLPPSGNTIQCFPRSDWRLEFALASRAHLDCIEWIFDTHGEDVNPLATDFGIEQVRGLSREHDVRVRSLCADYFMDNPLVRGSASELEDRMEKLLWLLARCRLLGIGRVVLPFVDGSRIDTEAEMDLAVFVLGRALRVSEPSGVEIHLETSLPPGQYARLLNQLVHPMLKVNYDLGNSAALGYRPEDEFNAYGNRVGSVHIKDRIHGGGTVPLGHGSVDFRAVFDCLRGIGYGGEFILQVARGDSEREVDWAERNRAFVMEHWSSSR